ncbi:MAG: hypothetical protein A2Z21_05985 [Candidatus Fraserbacteria bacterium RBG_16_55_9]|uniref:Outer membrane protein beta-barrel domain-containing protein n=1 Tax=Fraserbacteria sp. (strain RBG_16_55_9) TaxID=1817864 RepID=A0A1F5V1U7_FRAXR|nr:MAG: hypothetical protein A2Z21_05985 [Candidatus Fraserbacteria bacterium RBG_16_55_9]
MDKESGLAVRKLLGVATMITLVCLGVMPRAAVGESFSGGGGPLLLGAFLDLSELEQSLQGIVKIQGDFNLGENQSLFLLRGGGGFGGSTLRLGGMGMEGSWTFPVLGESAFDRVALTLGGGGFLMDRLIAETDQGGVSLGILIGGGEWRLHLSKSAQGSFGEVIRQPVSLELHRSFWFASPYLSAEFRMLDFVGLRVGAGVWATLSFDDWNVQNGPPAAGGPLRNVIFPALQFMVVFGG